MYLLYFTAVLLCLVIVVYPNKDHFTRIAFKHLRIISVFYLSGYAVGDKKTFKVYSYDGIEYRKATENGLTDVLLGLCRIIFALLAVFIVGIVIARIKYMKSRGRRSSGGE